jgi:putative hydrolase of the HAD superfamily
MKTVLIVPRTPDPFRETWEQIAIEAGHVHHITDDLAAFLRPLGLDAPKPGPPARG